MTKLTSMPACFALGEALTSDFIRNNPVDDSPAAEISEPSTELLDTSIAVHKVQELASDFLDKRAAVMGNRMQTDMQNQATVDRIAKKYQTQAAAAVETGLRGVQREFDRLHDEMTPRELKPVVSSQILDALRDLSKSERDDLLADMDDDLYSTIYHSHHIAAGLTKKQRDIALDNHRMKHFRRNMRRIERIGKLKEIVIGQIVPSCEKFFGEAVDQRELDHARQSQAAADAAIKAAIDG